MHRDIPNPKVWMRARHPNLFSDTKVGDSPQLSKAVFEYYLDTLTSRKQEYVFEYFCRKLAEKEICPNLRPQTGPTGGGDSKVDTETYPVAEEITERWYIGSPSAGAERWAFAFSAKKKWRAKIKADVDNILSTSRDYKRIYFFTNQFVSDKKRSAYEDNLSESSGIPVHIFDRAWIMEKVYECGHLKMAIAALGIEDAKSEKVAQTGPLDAARLDELDDLDIPAEESPNDVQKFFEEWQDQPSAKDIPTQPLMIDSTDTILKSTILGTEYEVQTPNNVISFSVAESLLGALEAFLSTSNEQDVLPYQERLKIVISGSDHPTDKLQLRFPGEHSDRTEIFHPLNLCFKTAADRQDFIEWLRNSIAEIVPRVMVVRNASVWLEKIAGKEQGFARSLALGDILTLNLNLFGPRPAFRIADWMQDQDKPWPLLRDKPWREAKPISTPETGASSESLKFGVGEPPHNLIDQDSLKHNDRLILSPIDMTLWDLAKWRATMFAYIPNEVPILALAFENGQAGQLIFQGWIERWGVLDKDDALRLAIIKGLCKSNPAEYAVVVGPNLPGAKDHQKKLVVSVSRYNRMTPSSTVNLDRFIAIYQRAGAYLLSLAEITAGTPRLFHGMAIRKRYLHIRQAWEIGENDPDMIVLHDDDEPIIPSEVADPPVNRAMAWMRSIRKSTRNDNP